jgi:osmotically-inducible protein OsmY
LTDSSQDPGRKLRNLENDGDGDKYFDTYRYTPFTTDLEFFRDRNIHEADEVSRFTLDGPRSPVSDGDPQPPGESRSAERMKDEIQQLLARQGQIDASTIAVEVKDGVVTLSGNVDSRAEKRMAERIAKNAFGVLEMISNLSVNTEEP